MIILIVIIANTTINHIDRFISKIFHPNVYADGKICLDILQNQWSPIYDIAAILTSIQSLLSDPNPASPGMLLSYYSTYYYIDIIKILILANAEASQLFEKDRREYNRRVRQVVEESWMDDSIEGGDEDGEGGEDDDNNDNNETSASTDNIVNNTVFSSIDQSV